MKSGLKLLFTLLLLLAGGINARADRAGIASRTGIASVYGGSDGLCGSRTANGERFNCAGLTAAHKSLRLGARVRVCHNGCVTVRINDRGPFVRGRDIDLSPAAARAIGVSGVQHVTIEVL